MTSTYNSISSISSASSSLGAATLTSPPRSVKKMRISQNDSANEPFQDDVKMSDSFLNASTHNLDDLSVQGSLPLPPLPPPREHSNGHSARRHEISNSHLIHPSHHMQYNNPPYPYHNPSLSNLSNGQKNCHPVRMIDANGCIVKRTPIHDNRSIAHQQNYHHYSYLPYYNSYSQPFYRHNQHHLYPVNKAIWNTPSPERVRRHLGDSEETKNNYERSPSIVPIKNKCRITEKNVENIPKIDPRQEESVTLLLAMPEDIECLSDRQCYVRTHLVEVFCATKSDVSVRHSKGAQKLTAGQVGIRCRFCYSLPAKDRAERAVCFPSTLSRIYQTVADMQRFHFESCSMVPCEVRKTYRRLKTTRPRGMGSPQNYWIASAKRAGLVDSKDSGIRLGENVNNIVTATLTPDRVGFHSEKMLSSPSISKIICSNAKESNSIADSIETKSQSGDDRDDANILLLLKSTPRIDSTSTSSFNGDLVHI